jgi:hypothetical protein
MSSGRPNGIDCRDERQSDRASLVGGSRMWALAVPDTFAATYEKSTTLVSRLDVPEKENQVSLRQRPLRRDGEEVPFAGYAFESVRTPLVELQS